MASGKGGFTLVEVLVAFAILAMSAAVLMVVYSDGLDRASNAANETAAVNLARSLLDGLGHDRPIQDGTVTEGATGPFHWRIVVVPYGSEEDRANWPTAAHDVTLTVDWRDSRPHAFRVETIRLGAG